MSGGGPGGCNGKTKTKEWTPAAPTRDGWRAAVQRRPSAAAAFCWSSRWGRCCHPAHFQQDGAAGGHRRHVHRHQCHLCDGPRRAGYMEPVFAVRAGNHPDAHSGGRPWPVTLTSFFALAARRRMGFRDLRLLGESVSADGLSKATEVLKIVIKLAAAFRGRGHRAAALRIRAPVRRRGCVGQRVHGHFGLLQCRL